MCHKVAYHAIIFIILIVYELVVSKIIDIFLRTFGTFIKISKKKIPSENAIFLIFSKSLKIVYDVPVVRRY